jgi:hypothetical protein
MLITKGKLPKLSPVKLIQAVEDKIHVLKHAELWNSPSIADAPAMALNSTFVVPDDLKNFLANHITNELKKLIDPSKDGVGKNGKDRKVKQCFQHQDWMFIAPSNPSEKKTMQGRQYKWCAKCN